MMVDGTAHYYWLAHRRHYAAGRLAWYAEQADEAFWTAYWQARLTEDYFRAAAARDLAQDELGRILLREMAADGLHLEAGCGAGFWVAALQGAGLQVEGIEYAQGLVALVQRVQPALPVRFGDALAIDRPENSYDSYLSFGVVEHRAAGPEPFLAEARRVLKPGGKLIISVPHLGATRRLKARLGQYAATRPAAPFFQYAFTPAEFVRLVAAAGFTLEARHVLYVHRLLLEESGAYRWLTQQRGGRWVKRLARAALQGRDGHMLLVIARKPETG